MHSKDHSTIKYTPVHHHNILHLFSPVTNRNIPLSFIYILHTHTHTQSYKYVCVFCECFPLIGTVSKQEHLRQYMVMHRKLRSP